MWNRDYGMMYNMSRERLEVYMTENGSVKKTLHRIIRLMLMEMKAVKSTFREWRLEHDISRSGFCINEGYPGTAGMRAAGI